MLLSHLVRRVWAYMREYEDSAGDLPFGAFFTEDEKKKNVYFTRKVQMPASRFPNVSIFVKKVVVVPGGFPNTVLWNITLGVYFYTLSYDEDDMSLHYYWIENLERVIHLNRHLVPLPAPDDVDLCVQTTSFGEAETEFAFGDDFVIDETHCEIEVHIKLAGIKI